MTGRCLCCLEPLSTGEMHHKCYNRLFGARKVRLRLRYLRSDIMIEAWQRAVRMSLGGAQPKVGIAIQKGELEVVTVGATHLLKPSTERHPFISENEHLCMNIAVLCGLPVPPLCLIPLADGELAFLIKRFDRDKVGKVHVEDLASALSLPADSKYGSDYLRTGMKIAECVRDKGVDKLLFLKQVMLSYLLGNNDLHLKNFSLIDRGEYYALSPVYDIVCAARYYQGDDMAMPLAPDYFGHLETEGLYTVADFYALGGMLGIGRKPLDKIAAVLIAAKPRILALTQDSFLPEREKRAITEIVREQFRKFETTAIVNR